MTAKITAHDLGQAVFAHWMRTGRAASSEDLAASLGVSVRKVRDVARATLDHAAYNSNLVDSVLPGCHTIASTPTRWEPSMREVLARLRGERQNPQRWLVTGEAGDGCNGHVCWTGVARSEEEALAAVSALYPQAHPSTVRLRAEWLGAAE
jgi:hypothetical protein